MPFTKTKKRFTKGKRKGQKVYTSPSGRKYSKKQVAMYYATKGFKKSLIRGKRKRKRKK